MNTGYFPLIDVQATGKNIVRLRKEKNLSVKDLQNYFGFEEPQAIYKWQWGQCLPSVDNLFALSYLLDVPLTDILVEKNQESQTGCGSNFLYSCFFDALFVYVFLCINKCYKEERKTSLNLWFNRFEV